MTKYYVDEQGNYLGGFDGANPPEGAIEVPSAPNHGRDKWIMGNWVFYIDVPTVVDMRQARLALLGAGLLGNIDAAIASLPSPDKEYAQIEWEFSPIVKRDSPLVQMLSGSLGLDESALDALFIAAGNL